MHITDARLIQQIDTVLEADFLGRAQTLTLELAEHRLTRSLKNRSDALAGNHGDPQLADYWRTMGYRSVAYDAAGLTATMVRMFADSEHDIVGAHMRLMRSMIVDAPEPNVGPLLAVLAELRSQAA